MTSRKSNGLLVGELHALVGRYVLMIAWSNRTAVTVWDSGQRSNQMNYVPNRGINNLA
jgi:hypothetical protein